MRRKLDVLLVIGIVLSLWGVRGYCEESSGSTDLKPKLKAARNSRQAGALYADVLTKASTSTLKEAKHDPDIGIALHAAWQLHNIKVQRNEDDFNPPIVDPKEGARFLGFFEGRTVLTPPRWWQETLLDPYLGGREKAFAEVAHYSDVPPERVWGEFLMLPPHTSLRRKGGTVVARVGDESVELPSSLFEQAEKKWLTRCLIDIGGRVSIIVFYDHGSGVRFPIICVDSKSGRVNWRTESWGTGDENLPPAGSGGSGHNYVEVKRRGNRLVLYGGATWGSYAEAFDIRTGQSLFRFSTNYWNAPRTN